MNKVTDKQRKYLQTILEWLYATPIPYDEFHIYVMPDIPNRQFDTIQIEPAKYTYKVSILKYMIETVLLDTNYNEYAGDYLNTLKPLYKHIKKLQNAKLDT